MKKSLLVILLLASCISAPCFSDSISLSTSINGISGGEYAFGLGMFPLGTNFDFYKYFTIFPTLRNKAYFQTNLNFSFTGSSFGGYDFYTGRPQWAEKTQIADNYSGKFFKPTAFWNIFLEQGFGTNPLDEGSSLIDLRIGFNSYYTMALEPLDLSRGLTSTPTFVDADGNLLDRFSSEIPAYPWLQGSRRSLNNYMYTTLYLNMDVEDVKNTYEGLYGYVGIEYGPKWFANDMFTKYPTSDFIRLHGYFEQNMILYEWKQDNGWNWNSMYVGHSNSASYIWGDIVPENKITTDRLRGMVSDRLWLTLTGPQFIAGDCYTYFTISLNNNLYWGGVANETDDKTRAVELKSSINMNFHLLLFGFINFDYSCGYNFIRGIWAQHPAWTQNAGISFYVSL